MNNSTMSRRAVFSYNIKRGVVAVIDYSPMWETMERKGISQYRLLKAGIDNKTLDSVKKGKNITLITLEKLCAALECTPNEVVRFVADDPVI